MAGTDGAEYRTEVESFRRALFVPKGGGLDGDPDHWEVHDRDGTVRHYGRAGVIPETNFEASSHWVLTSEINRRAPTAAKNDAKVHDASTKSRVRRGPNWGSTGGTLVPVQDRMFSDELCYREDGNCTTANLLLLPSFGDLARVAVAAWEAVFGAPAVPTTQSLTAELTAQGVKFTAQNIVAIERIGGRIVFLETGTAQSGLTHILARHASDFAAKGIAASEIPAAVMAALRTGTIVGGSAAKPLYEFLFNGGLQRIAVVVGSNGYVVTAHPAAY